MKSIALTSRKVGVGVLVTLALSICSSARAQTCFGIPSTDLSVCSNHGICVALDSCQCTQGYSGIKCQNSSCFGILSTDPNVCSTHGACDAPDNCVCNTGYSGIECQNSSCFGIPSTDQSVCSNHGICVAPDSCLCTQGYSGPACQNFSCFGIPSTDQSVCSSHGICVAPDSCECDTGYSGPACQNLTGLCGNNSIDSGEACDDGNTQDGDGCSSTCQFEGLAAPLDHFKCWQGKDLKDPKFEKIPSLPLDDQFGIENVEVKKLFLLCAPADKDGSGINDPNTHLCCYKIKAQKLSSPPTVELVDQFGPHKFEVKKPKFLCQPCTKTVLP